MEPWSRTRPPALPAQRPLPPLGLARSRPVPGAASPLPGPVLGAAPGRRHCRPSARCLLLLCHKEDKVVKKGKRCPVAVKIQVDAFAAEPFKGNPAAVCLLKEEDAASADERWMQSVAAEFNLSQTAFLVRDSSSAGDASTPRFHLRWFTPVAEVNLCGHAKLASAHFLFTTVLAKHDMVEFATKSGILTAKKVPAPENTGVLGEEEPGKLFIELDFPMIDLVECNSAELPSIPETLNDANIVSIHKSATTGDLIDPVCGSAHCVLAPYWGGKLGKQKLTAFQASPRSGTLYLELEDVARRVRIQGEAVTVMTGTLLA